MSAAFILGNGKSRLAVNLNKLAECGTVFGCNRLYRDFTPHCLVSTDRPIAEEIQNSGYAQQNRFHTTNGMFNNIYAGTQFYKKELDSPTFPGNWIKQVIKLTEDFNSRQFWRVQGVESAFIPQFNKIQNMRILSMDKFLEKVNTARGPL